MDSPRFFLIYIHDPMIHAQPRLLPCRTYAHLSRSGSKTRLLASSGKEYIQPSGIFQNTAEVKKARKAAMNRVGLDFLDVADDDEMDLNKELAAGDDLDVDSEMKTVTPQEEDKHLKAESSLEPRKAMSPAERFKSSTPHPGPTSYSEVRRRHLQ